MAKRYTDEDVEFLKENYATKGGEFCAQKLGRNIDSIKYKVRFLGIKSKYILRERMNLQQFKEIKTAEVAYLLGYLWADGWVGPRQVTLEIAAEDFLDVKPVVDKIGDWSIRQIKPHPMSRGKTNLTKIAKYDTCFANLLGELGFREKSLKFSKEIIGAVPKEIQHYFWRGFVDGDGCIFIKSSGAFILTLACSIEFDWSQLENILNEMDITFCHAKVVNKDGSGNSRIVINNFEGCKKFLSYIYQGRDFDKIGLQRKYDKFLQGMAYTLPENGRAVAIEVRDKENNLIGSFRNILGAARELNMHHGTIRECLRKNRRSKSGLLFKKTGKQNITKKCI